MSRGSFTALDIYRSHVTMAIVGEIVSSVEWSEYLAVAEFFAVPPLKDPVIFAELARRIEAVAEEYRNVALALDQEISKERGVK